ncbi:MAG: hypothetical protein RRA51_04905, partial [Armatimonadota bacterium]|nr:hypothetical protein [Armatimonadota bacterium]
VGKATDSEWRLASSKWRMVFLEGSAPALPKNSAHQEMRPPVFQPVLAGFIFAATNFKWWFRRFEFLIDRLISPTNLQIGKD